MSPSSSSINSDYTTQSLTFTSWSAGRWCTTWGYSLSIWRLRYDSFFFNFLLWFYHWLLHYIYDPMPFFLFECQHLNELNKFVILHIFVSREMDIHVKFRICFFWVFKEIGDNWIDTWRGNAIRSSFSFLM